MNKYNKIVYMLAGLFFPLLLWEAYTRLGSNPLVPPIEDIYQAIRKMTVDGSLYYNGSSTLINAFAGLALAFVAGNALGVACARNKIVGAALEPIVSFSYPVPKLALYPVMILAFGFGSRSKIIQVAMECFFPIFVQSYAGTRSVGRELFWLCDNVNANAWQRFKDVVIMSILPNIFVGLRIAVPIMLIVIVVTELIGVSRGLGFLISESTAYLEPSMTWAVVVILGVIGYSLDTLIVYIRRRIVFWEREDMS